MGLAEPMEALLFNAAPALERLCDSVGGAGVCLLVSNAEGIPLIWRGAQGDAPELRERGL